MGTRLAKNNRRQPNDHQRHQRQDALANERPGETDVDFRGAREDAIEPVEEACQQPAALPSGPQQQPGEGRAQREGVKGGEDHRDRDGHGELLVEPSGDARDERGRHKHRRENQGDADDRAGKLVHGFSGRVLAA